MAKNPKTKRTQIQDLPQTAQELTLDEANRVKGGAAPSVVVEKAKTADKIAVQLSAATTARQTQLELRKADENDRAK